MAPLLMIDECFGGDAYVRQIPGGALKRNKESTKIEYQRPTK
jgi:hypothetical protein